MNKLPVDSWSDFQANDEVKVGSTKATEAAQASSWPPILPPYSALQPPGGQSLTQQHQQGPVALQPPPQIVLVEVKRSHFATYNDGCAKLFECRPVHGVSFLPAAILASIVMFSSGCIVGVFAFLILLRGQAAAEEMDLGKARRLRNLSIAVSVFGIVASVASIVVVIVIINTVGVSSPRPYFNDYLLIPPDTNGPFTTTRNRPTSF